MPSDSPSHGRRHHFRGRRGHERRGGERRTPAQGNGASEPSPRGDHVDVEQIMREIRARIAQRHGIELNDQQVQDLAARRLESILDPRGLNPSLLEQLRRSAGARPESVSAADNAAVPYEFEDTTLYDSPSGFTRFIRKLLNPILKLFFNPNPLIQALHVQSRLNVAAVRREADRDQRQAEWNALHYEILRRVVSEAARLSLEVQNLTLQVESLSAKVDFNERRVRGIEGVVHQGRSGGREREREREREPAQTALPPASVVTPDAATAPPAVAAAADAAGPDAVPRRRRRRRRGRRGSGEALATVPAEAAGGQDAGDSDDLEEGAADVYEGAELSPGDMAPGELVTTGTEAIDQLEAAGVAPPPVEASPERVTPQLASDDPAAREDAAPELPLPAPSTDKTDA